MDHHLRIRKPISKKVRGNIPKNTEVRLAQAVIQNVAQESANVPSEGVDDVLMEATARLPKDIQCSAEGQINESIVHSDNAHVQATGTCRSGRRSGIVFREWADVINKDTQNVALSEISQNEKDSILEIFDIKSEYGPFAGIDRKKRWLRAESWGLKPPVLVYRILDDEGDLAQRRRGYTF